MSSRPGSSTGTRPRPYPSSDSRPGPSTGNRQSSRLSQVNIEQLLLNEDSGEESDIDDLTGDWHRWDDDSQLGDDIQIDDTNRE